MSDLISPSRFYMWRTLFALVHADGIVTDEEIKFMQDKLESVPFSDVQRHQLCMDMAQAQNIMQLFDQITGAADQAEFFNIARALVHIDGDYGSDERAVLLKLKERHIQSVNVDDLIGKMEIELEDPPKPRPAPKLENPVKGENNLLALLQKFFQRLT